MKTLLVIAFYIWLFIRIYRFVYPALYGGEPTARDPRHSQAAAQLPQECGRGVRAGVTLKAAQSRYSQAAAQLPQECSRGYHPHRMLD